METRSSDQLFLLNHFESQIVGAKLPSNGQLLRVLFYNMRKVNLNLRESAALVMKEVEIFWEKARIPIKKTSDSINKVEKLYNKWRTLNKTVNRQNDLQRKREQEFIDSLEDLFDIAHANALEMISVEEDKIFLLQQREKRRIGSMASIDRKLVEKEERQAERKEQQEMRWQRAQESSINDSVQLESTSTSSDEETEVPLARTIEILSDEPQVPDGDDTEAEDYNIPGPSNPKKRRGKQKVITPKLVAVLDSCRISDRDAIRIVMATAECLGHDLNELIINRTSIRRYRHNYRSEHAAQLQEMFGQINLRGITIHWDATLIPDISHKNVERLPIVISCGEIKKLLGIPVIPSGSGANQASAIFSKTEEWNLSQQVEALCFDTTATNTGRIQGACVLLEQKLEKELLYLPCRHHIYELILRAAFDTKMKKSTGPDVPLFKKFKNSWSSINKDNFKPGVEDEFVRQNVIEIDKKIEAAIHNLQQIQPRDDYKELIELMIIFLGGTPPKGVRFRMPGAFHHARWMAKAIYCIKIYIFRNEFHLSSEKKLWIQSICIFLINIYILAWVRTTVPAIAPRLDLELLSDLWKYKEIDETISNATLQKLSNHLWYLSPENVGLSFFDPHISVEIKKKMVEALNKEEEQNCKKLVIPRKDIKLYIDITMDNFVSTQTLKFFSRFDINIDFMSKDPALWEADNNYKAATRIVGNLQIVNDVAERAVKLMKEYSDCITKDENERQDILQIVSEYKQRYPTVDKKTLSQHL
ncbi:uncharacterized protein LOC143208527 isoform X1 [Lasioglossum baleicum]|uniref:uncharacterized protein LOC143208527 isoform X1 n=1 Tax=Lasioglossum baleicum TaxID=434251 RepID=UPI003FCCD8AF